MGHEKNILDIQRNQTIVQIWFLFTRHANCGIPYRKGYLLSLLYGPPRAGKSSLCSSLAGHFDLDVYILDISSTDFVPLSWRKAGRRTNRCTRNSRITAAAVPAKALLKPIFCLVLAS